MQKKEDIQENSESIASTSTQIISNENKISEENDNEKAQQQQQQHQELQHQRQNSIDGNLSIIAQPDNEDQDSNAENRFYPEYAWRNITKEFFDACSELQLGELIHDEIFGLFEAMSAIEMMDPKMDVGMGFNKNEPTPHTFQSAVEAGILKLNDLENSELIGIFDALYACLVSWLEGHSLDQILFTCLYLHMPNSIEDKSLRTFCLAVRKLISLIKDFVIDGSVSEEEDFQLFGSSGLNFFDHVPGTKVISLLKEAEDDLVKKSKSDDCTDPEGTLAVMHRLRFLRFLFQSLFTFWVKKETSYGEQDITEVQRYLNAALELVPLIRKTIEKGTQPEPNSEAPNPMGFSPRVNQRNLPPTFPRSAKIKDRLSSLQFLEELVHRLKLACKVIHQKDYHSALNFFIDYSKKSEECLLSRSVLQILFFGKNRKFVFGTIPYEEFLKESIKQFIAPPVLVPRNPLSGNTQARNCVDTFIKYSVNMHTFVYFLQICGFNRARQRDKLARLIEEGFANLQDEAGRVDSYLNLLATKSETSGQHIAYFGTWTLYHCLRAMALYLLSGFELELYSVHEFFYIYWYLYEFLFGFIVSALTRAESLAIEQENYFELQFKQNSKQRKIKPNKKKKQKPYRREIVYNHAMQNMCGGYYKIVAAFTKEERIRQPMPKFDNERIRFNHRFAPFSNLTSPPPIPYNEFKKTRSHHLRLSATELYLSASKHFHQARTILESMQNPDQEMIQMIQVAKVNFIVANLLANGHKRDSKTQPEFDFSQNRYFPIIKLN